MKDRIEWERLEIEGEPIHGANRLESLDLTEDQALPYLDFFCDFMKAGDEVLIASFELLPSGHVIMLDDETFWPEGG